MPYKLRSAGRPISNLQPLDPLNTLHEISGRRVSTTQAPVVLIVDDDKEMRAYLRQCLASLPVDLKEACDGREALRLIQSRQWAALCLVISDVYMPRMSGLALKAALQEDPRWKQVPVLLITGEALRVRERPMLRKPFNARQIRAAVQNLLNL